MYTSEQMTKDFGVSLGNLLFYEKRGFLKPERVGKARFYSERDAIRLQVIQRGQQLGLSLYEIDRMMSPQPDVIQPDDVVTQLSAHDIEARIGAYDEQIERLRETQRQLKLALEQRRSESCG